MSLPSSRQFNFLSIFLGLFVAILVLFVLLSYYLPPFQSLGWFGIVLFLFLYFVGEPLYRYSTDRWEIHVLVLEIYVFSSFLIQLFFPDSPFVYLFYMIPVFSAALSFGLMGTMLTAMGIFSLEFMRFSIAFFRPEYSINTVLVKTLPVFILALILGFTVELKNRIQKQLLNRLSRMEVFQTLRGVLDTRQSEESPFDYDFVKRIVDLTDVEGAVLGRQSDGELLERVNLTETRAGELVVEGGDHSSRLHEVELEWETEKFRLILVGQQLTGVLLEAEEQMIDALGVYVQHLLDHQLLKRELARENQYRESIFEAVPAGIVLCTSTGSIIRANSTARDIAGGVELLDRSIQELFVREDEAIELQSGRREAQLNTELLTIPVDLAIEQISDDIGGETRWIGVFSDLSPMKELEQQAARKRRLVALGELGAGLAHEIRNPLGSLSGFVSLLEDRVRDNPDIGEVVNKIRRSYRKINDLITQFVQYAEEPQPNEGEFDAWELLENEVEEIHMPAQIELRPNNHYEQSPRIRGDANRLELVVRNLLRNAREAIEDGGRIDILLQPGDNGPEIIVRDDGRGIPDDRVDRIFDPFVSDRDKGLGLGLSTVHRIVTEEFSGGIQVDSEPGEGTTMLINLPNSRVIDGSETGENHG